MGDLFQLVVGKPDCEDADGTLVENCDRWGLGCYRMSGAKRRVLLPE